VGDEAGLVINSCDANFLNLLRIEGPLTPKQLGRLAELTSSGTITGAIDRLEKAGYVRRARSQQDRRSVVVSLETERLQRADAARADRLAALLAGYDEAQLETIADFVTRLADAEADAAVPTEMRPDHS
jgi:DNA-binding MarR family transcriptional regulator